MPLLTFLFLPVNDRQIMKLPDEDAESAELLLKSKL